MRNLVWTNSFSRALKKLLKERPHLREKIKTTIECLSENPYLPTLHSHKLKGKLTGANACTVEYDCRIIYEIKINKETNSEEILLIDIGTHDEVY